MKIRGFTIFLTEKSTFRRKTQGMLKKADILGVARGEGGILQELYADRFKILCQVEDFEHFFKIITLCTSVFEKSCFRRPSEARLIKYIFFENHATDSRAKRG